MQFDQARIERLLGEIEGAMRARSRKESRHVGENFNLFSVLARYGNNDERYVHTPFLGTLLDPTAEHDLADLFLRNFLDRALKRLDDIPTDSLDTAHVQIESDNVDIRILLDDFEIIIENKLHAPDQDKQLIRYMAEARQATPNVVVVYLTLRGTPPSRSSIGDDAEDRAPSDPEQDAPQVIDCGSEDERTSVPVVLLSYENDVRRALNASLAECRSDTRYNSDVAGALQQYSIIVDRVLGEKAMGEPSEEAAILMEKQDNLAIGLRMQAAANEAYGRRVAQFLLEMDKCFQTYRDSSDDTGGDPARLGTIVHTADIAGEGNKILERAQVENWTMIRNWATAKRGRTKDHYNHWALLWYGVPDGHWAFSVELAQGWIFLGFVRLSGETGGVFRIENLSQGSEASARISGWNSSTNRYGLRHAGAWENCSLVQALAEVPQSNASAERGCLNRDDPYGLSQLFAPDDVFKTWIKPYLGRSWDEVVGEIVGNRQR